MSKLKDIYEGFNSFKDRFLENKKSIFSDNQVFTKENLNKIIEGFAKNPDESDKSFDEKIKIQLGNATEVHELFAHIIWLWSLVASDMKQIGKIADINKWLDNDKKINENFPYSFNHGIMSTGQYHKTNQPLELVYIIYFLQKVLDNPERPFMVVLGGAKVADKIGLIDNLASKADKILIGGGMSYTFLKASGKNIGKSLLDEENIGQRDVVSLRYE